MPRSASRAAIRPGLRGATQVERLGHRPEIGDHAAGERGGDADRVARPRGIEPAQHRRGRGGGHRAEHGTRVPALAVMLVLVARDQLRPHLVARDIGRDHGLAVGTAFLCLRQDRGHQHGAGMAAERGIVEIEHVRGDRVEHRAVARRHAQAGGRERMLRQGTAGKLGHHARHRLAPARDHDRDAIGEARFDDRNGARRYPRRRDVGDKTSDLGGQAHGSPPTTSSARDGCEGCNAGVARQSATSRRWRKALVGVAMPQSAFTVLARG